MPCQKIILDREALSVWEKKRLEKLVRSIYREFVERNYHILDFNGISKGAPASLIIMGENPLPYDADIADITSKLGITFTLGGSHDNSWKWGE